MKDDITLDEAIEEASKKYGISPEEVYDCINEAASLLSQLSKEELMISYWIFKNRNLQK